MRLLNLRERRKLGFTIENIRAKAELLQAAGEEPTAEAIFSAILADVPPSELQALGANIDWDAILAFIEKLLPIILQLIALFG